MPRRSPRSWSRLALAAVVSIAPIAAATHAQTPASATSAPGAKRAPVKTTALQERLKTLKAEADALMKQQGSLLVQLRRLDVDRKIKATALEETHETIDSLEGNLGDTARRIVQGEAALEAAKPAIRERVVRVYKLGRLGYARILLDLRQARTFQQTARIVSMMARRDRAQLDRHQQLLTTLRDERTRLGRERDEIRAVQARIAGEQQALATSIAAYRARIQEVEERRDLNEQLATELTAAQARLSASVSQLTPSGGVSPGTTPGRAAIARFEWPLIGKVQTPFGRQQTSRFGTAIARNGIEISADEGTMVKAIDDGTVAFADVFNGFGQLVIVDHGRMTYSLYGHLATLAVQRGGTVERGQMVGSSGTTPTGLPAVYFELRIDGKPVDPVQWMKR